MPLRPKALMYQAFLRRFIQFEAGLFSLRLGHGTALTCPRHVIHSRAAASLPSSSPAAQSFYFAARILLQAKHGAPFYRRAMSSLSKKPRRVSRPQTRKAIRYVFCRDMCVAENTLRGVSVELSAVSGQLSAERTKLSRKSGKATFFDSLNMARRFTGAPCLFISIHFPRISPRDRRTAPHRSAGTSSTGGSSRTSCRPCAARRRPPEHTRRR